MNKEKMEEIMQKIQYLIDHADFYYEQRCESEPFLKQDYPFKKYSAKVKKEIEDLLKRN